jgi:VanZ family protein
LLVPVPVDSAPEGWPSIPHADKIVHALLFALGAALLDRRPLPLRTAVGISIAYGALLEGIQGLLPYRSAEGMDLLANAAGACCYALGVLSWRRWGSVR